MTSVQTVAQLDLRKRLELTGKLLVLKGILRGDRNSIEKKFEVEMRGFLGRWYALLEQILKDNNVIRLAQRQAQRIKQAKLDPEEENELIDESLNGLIAGVFDEIIESSLRRELVLRLQRHAYRTYSLGAVFALRSLGVPAKARDRRTVSKAVDPVIFELTDKEIISALDTRAIHVGRGIVAETIVDARRLIKEGIYEGNKTVTQVSREIAKGAGVADWRALKIARTETQAAHSQANYDMFARSGIEKHRWITVGDDRVRPEHNDNEADGWIQVGEEFSSGQTHPGDGVLSINCRCSLQPDIRDPKLLIQPWKGESGPYEAYDGLPIGPRYLARARENKLVISDKSGKNTSSLDLDTGDVLDKNGSSLGRVQIKIEGDDIVIGDRLDGIIIDKDDFTFYDVTGANRRGKFKNTPGEINATPGLLKRMTEKYPAVGDITPPIAPATRKITKPTVKPSARKPVKRPPRRPDDATVEVEARLGRPKKPTKVRPSTRTELDDEIESTLRNLKGKDNDGEILKLKRQRDNILRLDPDMVKEETLDLLDDLADKMFDLKRKAKGDHLAGLKAKNPHGTRGVKVKIDVNFNDTKRKEIKQGVKSFFDSLDAEVRYKGNLTVKMTGNRRSYYDLETEIVFISGKGPDTLGDISHEVGHWVEHQNNEQINGITMRFWDRRTRGERTGQLAGRGKGENGRADDWFKNYTGRVYSGRDFEGLTSEVFSTGTEYLMTDAEAFIKTDPEHAEFVLRILRGDLRGAGELADGLRKPLVGG